jgi:prepilin-type N-terminal cleavage/methylation domain-containing protein
MTPTSAARISKQLLRHQGFSLLEIMVALVLVGLVFLAIPSSDSSYRHQDIQRAMNDVDRAVRLASNESVLRNRVTRLRMDLDKDPVEYTVEYGPAGGDFVLPVLQDQASASLESTAKEQKKLASLDAQFIKIEEFEELSRELPTEVSVMGVASTWQKKLATAGMANVYFYPTGERDGALVFFTTQDEMAVLEVEPFREATESHYVPYPKSEEGSVAVTDDFRDTKMQEFYKNWQVP